MASLSDWKVSPAEQPKPGDYAYDLEQALSAVVGLHTIVPADAFTAETLGTERAGNGVLIRGDGLILTIGYLITEAQTVWITLIDGRAVQGHVLAYDQATGFGLVQALARLDLPALSFGDSSAADVGDPVVVAGAGGRQRSVAARIIAKQEFAGYWEYVLDEALFTAPAHPNWGGTAMIGRAGDLLGIGSLQVQQARAGGVMEPINMIVPIDLIKPILDDLLTLGRPNRPPRPWLGLYATEIEDKVVVAGLAGRGPARRADLRTGDIVLAVGGTHVSDLAALFRRVWSLGNAGVEVPVTVYRDGRTLEVRVTSSDRSRFLKGPSLH
ncbi:MAG TPA: S1C family serine protease [Xanthobacteraceae bacterium]|nr:S1C family serine protease [Xanthobacteraceae bacterium]